MSSGEVKFINGKRIATSEYRSWQMMKNRCLNKRACDYKYYGGRGISICLKWYEFDNFINDMGRKPTPLHTLERKNNDGSYCKSNCLWATRKAQARNRPEYVKLSLSKANKIRKMYASGNYYQRELAVIFNTTQVMVSQITRDVTWRNGGAQ
jgi:hypothetical protein